MGVPLGRTGIEVSALGVGTWAWGDRLWGYGAAYADRELEQAFVASLEAGVTLFDTAEVYGLGRSERLLGRFLASATAGRDGAGPAVVATKFMPFPWRLGRSSLLRALRASLRRLGVERVDLYQVHWPYPPVPIEAWMDAMADAVQAGLVRAVGVSNYSEAQMRRAHAALARRGVTLASNQVHYSLLHRAPERSGLLAACRELGVTLIAYSPLEQGVLTGKYGPDNPPGGFRRGRYGRSALERAQVVLAELAAIARRRGKTPAQVALNWVIGKGAIPIPGAKDARQARQNAGALGWHLTPDEMAALDAASDAAEGRPGASGRAG